MTYPTLWTESLDAAGRDDYVRSQWRLAHKIAQTCWRQSRLGIDAREDIIAAALLGLANAAAKFDPSLGYERSTYATYAVNRAVWLEIFRQRHGGLGGCSSGKPRYAVPAVELFREADGGIGTETWLPDVREPDNADDLDLVAKMVKSLPYERMRSVVRARFLDGLTLAECGRRFGVSKERVRQIVESSLAWLRKRYAELEVA